MRTYLRELKRIAPGLFSLLGLDKRVDEGVASRGRLQCGIDGCVD